MATLYMFSIVYSKNPQKIWLQILILLALIIVIYSLYKAYHNPQPTGEGFEQNTKYMLKRNEDIIDDFYIQAYDIVHPPETRLEAELNAIVQLTQPSKQSSSFLDVGSGTGNVVEILFNKGYKSFGTDKSQAMVDYSKKIVPSAAVSCGDATDSMLFEKGSFTHVLCTDFTVYSFQDKPALFRNCFHWLKSGGYLIVHLVDKPRFNSSIPASISFNPFRQTAGATYFSPSKERSLKTSADFQSFTYESEYDISDGKNTVLFREKFTDKSSNHIRENEQTLYMDEIGKTVNDALQSGFMVHGKMSLADINGGDEHQYFYIFERGH